MGDGEGEGRGDAALASFDRVLFFLSSPLPPPPQFPVFALAVPLSLFLTRFYLFITEDLPEDESERRRGFRISFRALMRERR